MRAPARHAARPRARGDRTEPLALERRRRDRIPRERRRGQAPSRRAGPRRACARRDGRVASRSETRHVLFNASPQSTSDASKLHPGQRGRTSTSPRRDRRASAAPRAATENHPRAPPISSPATTHRAGEPVILADKPDVSPTEASLMSELRDALATLTLSNDAIWARERARPEVPAPWIIKAPYLALCYFLDVVFPENRPIQRFWFLETVARMPYFSQHDADGVRAIGWWRNGRLRSVHFAESGHATTHRGSWGDGCSGTGSQVSLRAAVPRRAQLRGSFHPRSRTTSASS